MRNIPSHYKWHRYYAHIFESLQFDTITACARTYLSESVSDSEKDPLWPTQACPLTLSSWSLTKKFLKSCPVLLPEGDLDQRLPILQGGLILCLCCCLVQRVRLPVTIQIIPTAGRFFWRKKKVHWGGKWITNNHTAVSHGRAAPATGLILAPCTKISHELEPRQQAASGFGETAG